LEAFFEAISVSCGFFEENWPIFQNFLLKYLENLENFEKNPLPFPVFLKNWPKKVKFSKLFAKIP